MKVYVGVESYTDEIGRIRPKIVCWEDGRRFEIQQVLEERRAPGSCFGAPGMRFSCLINGVRRDLFFEGQRWFVLAVKK